MIRGVRLLAAALALCAAAGAGAQAPPASALAYPAKAIRLVVPFPPGGVTDRLARTMGQKLQEAWGQPVIVDNRPGASGMIAGEAVAKAAPDGYTLMMGHIGTHAVNASLYPAMPYDPVKDFAPISLLVSVPNLVLAHPSVPAGSMRELIALARGRPGRLNYASPGSGSSTHMTGELLKLLAGVVIVHVPYKGPGPAQAAVLAGEVDLLFDPIASTYPHVKAGRLKGLAVTSTERSPAAPEIPTVAESGVPGFEVVVWVGAFAPAGTPPAIVRRLNAELVRSLEAPDVRGPLVQQGVTPVGSTPDAFAAHVQRELAKWARVVKETGARAE
jgi:tripartite-type tricarboxylate transporter receptor subunit TctC